MAYIMKVEPRMKTRLCKLLGCRWSDVRIVLVEFGGIRVYYKEMGTQKFFSFNELNNKRNEQSTKK